MKKLGLALVAALAIVLLGAPFATGMLTESNLTQRVEAIDASPSLGATIVAYERGWTRSRVELELTLGPQYAGRLEAAGIDPAAAKLPIVVEILHGPISVADGFHAGMTRIVAHPDPEWSLAQTAMQRYGMPYIFEFRGQSGFGSRFDFEADVPPVDYAGPEGEILFSGLDVSGFAAGNQLVIGASSDRLSYQSMFASGSIDSIMYSAEYAFRGEDWPVSTTELAVGGIVATSPLLGAEPLFEGHDIRISAGVALDPAGETIEVTTHYAAGSVSAGEEFALSDAELGVTLGNLDAELVREYSALAAALRDGDTETMDVLASSAEELSQQIVMSEPRASLDPIRFSMPEGSFEGNVTATIDSSAIPAGQPADLRDLAVLMTVLGVSADASVSKPLAQRLAVMALEGRIMATARESDETLTPDQIRDIAGAQAGLILLNLVGQGFLADNGDAYSSSLRFQSGGVTINGAPLPLGLF